jgi:hypothetical protein
MNIIITTAEMPVIFEIIIIDYNKGDSRLKIKHKLGATH